jgi:protein-disulfide isomerase
MAEEEKKVITIHLPNINLWMIATLVLAVVLIVVYLKGFSVTGLAVLTSQQAANKAIDYINKNLVQTGTASLVSVEEMSGVYKVITSYQGQQIPVYVTKDGRFLILQQATFDMTKEITTTTTQQVELFSKVSENSKNCLTKLNIDTSKIETCLKENGLKFVQNEFDLCKQYDVSGSPTIFLNGEEADPARVESLRSRSPEAFKKLICCSFNTVPSVCENVNCTGINVKKSDKPKLTVFVMSECPYGISVLQALAQLYDSFKGIVDFDVHYVIYGTRENPTSMHGNRELNEDAVQLCIINKEGQSSFWKYVTCFYGSEQTGSSGGGC